MSKKPSKCPKKNIVLLILIHWDTNGTLNYKHYGRACSTTRVHHYVLLFIIDCCALLHSALFTALYTAYFQTAFHTVFSTALVYY